MKSEIKNVVTKQDYPQECIKLVVIFIIGVTESCAVKCFKKWI